MPGQIYQPATTYLAVHVVPNPAAATPEWTVATAHLGGTRAYFVPNDGGPAELLTAEDRLHAFLGERPRTAPIVTLHTLTRPGRVVVATDGLYAALPGFGKKTELMRLAEIARAADPVSTVRNLVERARREGKDNITAAAIVVG